MGSIYYDPERILNGFTEESLKGLAKRLKRKIRIIKRDIIQDILSPPRGNPADGGKVWQEINRNLRKELEAFSKEEINTFSLSDTPIEEQWKVSYMFTLSSNPEIKAMGENLYQAQLNKVLNNSEKDHGKEEDGNVEQKEREQDKREEANLEDEKALEVLAAISAVVETIEVKEPNNNNNTGDEKEAIVARDRIEQTKAKDVIEPSAGEVKRSIGDREFKGMQEATELKNKIKTQARKLEKTYSDGLKTKGQLEKLKSEWTALKFQLQKEKEENEKYRNRVRELEEERIEKDKEIGILKKKLEQFQNNNLPHVKVEHNGKIDFAAFQGRKALIFAEQDNAVDSRLNALGIIPIWAMEIDWNRPRRRMSTCQIVLYKMNSEKVKKLEEIRDIARYLNIPCSELLDV